MSRTGDSCKAIVDGVEITPEWLVEHREMEFEAARQRIYKFNRGKMSAKTLTSYPTVKRKVKVVADWKPGTWESKNIKDRGGMGECRAGRAQGKPDSRHMPVYAHGQFCCPYTNLFR